IRDFHVTGVQTCALPIFRKLFCPTKKASGINATHFFPGLPLMRSAKSSPEIATLTSRCPARLNVSLWFFDRIFSSSPLAFARAQIGRASCRERVDIAGDV